MTIDENRFEIPRSTASLDLKGYTLLLPCVSIGSVPQLAVDALLEPTNAKNLFGQAGTLIGTVDHRFCVPFLGGAPTDISSSSSQVYDGIQEPLRLYSFPKAKVTILQQRSPILKSRKHEFIERLLRWTEQRGFSDVVILTSLDAGLRTDAQMNQAFWYTATTGSMSTGSSPIVRKMKEVKVPLFDETVSASTTSTSPPPSLPSGGGLANVLLQAFTSSTLSAQSLFVFAAEGDNRADAMAMATLTASLVTGLPQHSPASLVQPSDWTLLFGSQASDSMFN